MIRTIDEKSIIGDKKISDSTRRRRIKKYMHEHGYESHSTLDTILDIRGGFGVTTRLIFLMEEMKLIPWMDNVYVVGPNRKTLWIHANDAYKLSYSFIDWLKTKEAKESNAVKNLVKDLQDEHDEDCKQYNWLRHEIIKFDDTYQREWSTKNYKNLIRTFFKNVKEESIKEYPIDRSFTEIFDAFRF